MERSGRLAMGMFLLLAVCSTVQGAAGLDNPSFESLALGVVSDGTDVDIWKSWNGNFTVVNTLARTGSKSVKIGANTTAYSNFRQSDMPAGSPASIENAWWTCGFWVYYDSSESGNNSATDKFGLEFLATNNWNIHLKSHRTTITPAMLTNKAWTYVEASVYVGSADLSAYTPGTSDYINRVTNRVVIQAAQNSPGETGTFYIDDAVLYRSSHAFNTNPANGAKVPPRDPLRLSWNNPTPANVNDPIMVDVYLSTSPSEASWTQNDRIVTQQPVSQVNVSIAPSTTYYWKIIAYNTSAPTAPVAQSQVLTFSVDPAGQPSVWTKPGLTVDVWTRLVDNSSTPKGQTAQILGKWNTPGSLDGWTTSGLTDIVVADYYLTATATRNAPFIQLTGIENGPDLDFGYFDYIQFQMKLPASVQNDIIIFYGTSSQSGIDPGSNMNLVIPAEKIPQDGQWHSYRLDLGLAVRWRDRLTDIRIMPFGSAGIGQTFSIDYFEVGDLPGDVLLLNTNLNIYSGETLANCSSMESKHAAFWWSPQSYQRYSGFNPEVMGRRALRMIEESYQIYCNKLHYQEPFESFDTWRRNGNRYKINHITWYDGFWCGGWNGFMHIGINGSGLLDEGWGNPTPHEFGHYVQGHQPGFLTGGHWESHANFLRNSRNLHYAELFGDLSGMMTDRMFDFSNFRQDHGSLIYNDFRIHHALQNFGGELGLPDVVADLWIAAPKEQTIYTKIASVLPAGTQLGDIVANGLRHWPFLDFAEKSTFKTMFWGGTTKQALFKYKMGSHLIPCQDKPGWYRVPFERAPERFAYMMHELVPVGNEITVTLQGFDLFGTTEDWRWSLAAADETWDNVSYSPLFAPGSGSITMQPGQTKLFLIVTAAPSDSSLNLAYTDNDYPVDKHPDRLRYAYEVAMTGAVPAVTQRQLNLTTTSGRIHSNGGGWVANTATVNASAYVGPNARVLGTAKIYNNARVEDYAVVMDSATVQNNAIVSGHALVMGSALIRDYARIRDRAIVQSSTVRDSALVEDYASVSGSATIRDTAIVQGCSTISGGTLSDTGIAGYDYSGGTLSDGVHFSHVPWGDWYSPFWWNTLRKPRGLIASYRVQESAGQVCWDEFGAQHALLRGRPLRLNDRTVNSAVLRLNGIDQYLVLDRSLCDAMQGTFSIRIYPYDNIDRPILFMGASENQSLRLYLNGSGQAQFRLSNGSATAVLTSLAPIPTHTWTALAVTVSGSQCTLYINGVQDAQTASTLIPKSVLGPNDYQQPEAFYIGRDWAGQHFRGRIDDMRFYNVTLNQAEIVNEMRRCGDVIGSFYPDIQTDFNGTSTTAESGVRNGLNRRLQADIYPRTSDDVTFYEPLFDSNDERSSRHGTGIGLDNGYFKVSLDNVGFWNTGVPVILNQWQTIALEVNGSSARFYVNNILRATRSYSANADSVAAKNYRIGYGMSDAGEYFYFDGLIKNVLIKDQSAAIPVDNPQIDITQDGMMDMADLLELARHWLQADCSVNNNWCDMTDLNRSGKIDLSDFAILSDHW
jgi:carbonic anhydrase/acetyltransferase-like protein (isoleucine patch superfamily)